MFAGDTAASRVSECRASFNAPRGNDDDDDEDDGPFSMRVRSSHASTRRQTGRRSGAPGGGRVSRTAPDVDGETSPLTELHVAGSASGGGYGLAVVGGGKEQEGAAASEGLILTAREQLAEAAREPCWCCAGVMLPFPADTFRILAVEFCERFAFYGVVYSLFTFMTLSLRYSTPTANLIMNALYTASPLSAMAGAYLADGPLGRPLTLLLCAGTYTVGLILVAVAALPSLFASFPAEPSANNSMYLACGLVFLGAGYGALKTCTGPLAADQVTARVRRHGLDIATADGDAAVVAPLFRMMYWVITVGSTAGILICPFLRDATGEKVRGDGGKLEPAAYYVPFILCAALSLCGVALFVAGVRRYDQFSFDKSSVIIATLFRAAWRALCHRCCGNAMPAAASPHAPSNADGGSSATSPLAGSFLAHGVDNGLSSEQQRAQLDVLRDLRQALTACRAFFVLPLYWLLGNQYSTNFVLQTSWMDRPSYLPPEALHNVSTVVSLAFIPLLGRVILPRMYGSRKPPTVPRIAIGFLCTVVAVAYGAVLQIILLQRGHINADEEYIPHDGAAPLSVWAQLPAYALQGISGCWVDITALEAAYALAPDTMKSLVVAVYWMCSGAAGLLGVFITPLFKPSMFVGLFFSLAGLLLAFTVVFAVALRHLDEEVHTMVEERRARKAAEAATEEGAITK